MKQINDNKCGPFIFLDYPDRFTKIYTEMCAENPIVKKIFENADNNRIFVKVSKNMSKENVAQYDNMKDIIISKSYFHNKIVLKQALLHEYVHFIQNMNIRKNFSNLILRATYKRNDFQSFAFLILDEVEAYLKATHIIREKKSPQEEVNLFMGVLRIYLRKFRGLGYAEQFDFLNMINVIENKEEFIKIAECLLNTLTGPEFGGDIFPKYDLNWDEIFKTFDYAYIFNRNFDLIIRDYAYSNEKLIKILNKKSKNNQDVIEEFLLKDNISYDFNKNLSLLKSKMKER